MLLHFLVIEFHTRYLKFYQNEERKFPYSEKSKKIRKLMNVNNYKLIGRLTWIDQIYKKKNEYSCFTTHKN